jgi:sugar O-acyltransferase (sialic acid O-acetyltransferase NeuD family)
MMQSLAILGGGGHGRSVADSAERAGWTSLSLFDDRPLDDRRVQPWSRCGGFDELLRRLPEFDGVLIGVGDNRDRLALHEKLEGLNAPLAVLIDQAASVSRHATIGAGSVLLAASHVGVGASLGHAVIINTGASVDHDCVVGDAVHISPGARLAGGVEVGPLSWIGIGACVRQGVRIGRAAIVGAGAVVIRDVPDGVTVVGNPARRLER